MSHHTEQDRTLALAGIFQALRLVQQTAYGRPCDAAAVQTTLQSVLLLDAPTVVEVYGEVAALSTGLRLVQSQLVGGHNKPDSELNRYLVTLLHLERQFSRRTDMLEAVAAGVQRARRQAESADITQDSVIALLAETYSSTVSTLRPRIMVKGEPQRLAESNVANRIRALLLAALRSTVLWRQCGGTRLRLLFTRARVVRTARELLP